MAMQIIISTLEHARRVQSCIAECDRYIAKEGPRDPALRPAEVQVCLDGYIAHRARLVAALEEFQADFQGA